MIPDWQLPPGVDRGLWDYLHSNEMVAGYERQMAASPLAAADVRFCEEEFPTPGRLIDLGCGTGRLCRHFAAGGFECVGVDLSDEMLATARGLSPGLAFQKANLVDLAELPDATFDYAACLFSTLGMVRGEENRAAMLTATHRILKPGGRFVLHAHNRGFHGLGWRRFRTGDLTMPQAYGGAPLTLHHFTYREIASRLESTGFTITRVVALGLTGALPRSWWLPHVRAYGYLVSATKPV
jgi:SAM-dependent methyltransferase